jgi:hypothetical protein
MTKIVIYLILSFYLDGIISTMINTSTNFLNPLFNITALVIIYKFFEEKKNIFHIIISYWIIIWNILYRYFYFKYGSVLIVSIFIKFIIIYLAHNI